MNADLVTWLNDPTNLPFFQYLTHTTASTAVIINPITTAPPTIPPATAPELVPPLSKKDEHLHKTSVAELQTSSDRFSAKFRE